MNPLLDYFNRKDKPSLILLTPSLVPVGSLGSAYNLTSTLRFSAISELSFSYPMSIDNGKTKTEAYDNLKVKMILELEGVGRYIISECPESSDGSTPIKNITAQSLESEMLYKRITALSGTFPFYDSLNPPASVIGKVLKLLPEWGIGIIDSELSEMYRTFDVGNNTIYNFLTSDVSNAFGCVFTFNTFNKTINATLIKNLENHSGGFMSLDNTNRSVTATEFSDEICTAMNCYGGTDLDIHSANPIGGNTIYNFDYYINDTVNNWMSEELKQALGLWKIKLKENIQLYRDIALANNVAIAEYTTINQRIVEYQSTLDALQVTLEGLQAIPTHTEDAEAQATRLAEIEKTTNDIANTQVAIRKARSDKATKRQEIDNNFGELRIITNNLRFNGQQSWQALADDVYEIILKFSKTSEDWQSVIFETADDLEIDIPQFANAIAPIELDIADISYEMQALYEDVSAKILQYWNLNSAHKSSVALRLNTLSQKISNLCYKFDNLISNVDMTIELRSDAEKLLSYAPIVSGSDNLTKSESDELEHFIFYNTYTNNNIITTDIMTEEEIQEQALMLYDQAVEVLKRSSNPRYELSGDFISIINAPEFYDLTQKLDLGKQVTIELPDGNQHTDITLLEMSYNYDAPDSFTMTFSNRIKLNTSNFKFADMFLGIGGGDNTGLSGITNGSESKAGSISQSQSLSGTNLLSVTNALISKLGFVSFGPTPPTKYGNYVGSWFGYDKGAKLSLYSSATDYMQWTGDKLLIKAKNFTLDSNGNITANNADLAGKITAATGDIGGWIIEQDKLRAETGDLTLNSYTPSITLGAATSPDDGNGLYMGKNISTGSYVFRVGNPSAGEDYFAWDQDGIHISGDWIAGWTISSSSLSSGTGSSVVTINSIAGEYPAFSAGSQIVTNAPFRVYHDGRLFASEANISGSITATSGEIGGWSVTSTCIVDSSGLVGLSSENTGGDDIRFWAGSTNPEDALFYVTEGGMLHAENAFVTGSIVANVVEATSGSIGGWVIADNNLHSGSANNYVEINSGSSTGDYTIISGGSTPSLANFILYNDGSIKASRGTIANWSITPGSLISPSGSAGITDGLYAFYAGDSDPSVADFSVTYDGEIKATSGEIAGWSITSSSFVSPSGSAGIISASGVSDSDFVFFSGGATPEESTFYVTNGGKLVAKNISAIGNIDATSGNIGEWVIEEGALYSIDRAIYLNGEYSKITVGDPGNSSGSIIIDGADSSIRSDNYTPSAAGFAIRGNGDAEFNNVKVRGEIQSAIFKYNEMSATAGTLGVYKSADVLSEDLTTTSGSFALYTSNITSNLFSINDILRIKNGIIADNWIKVLQTPIAGSISYYECELLDGSESIFEKGTAVIDYGQYENGDGFLYMSSDETFAPYYSVRTITSASPWNDTSEKVRIGNIASFNGITDSTTRYGIAVGEEDNYLYYSTEDGLVIKGNVTITSGSIVKSALPNGTAFMTSASIAPAPADEGDYWLNEDSLKVYQNSEWVEVIGGYATASQIEAITNGYSSDSVLSIEEKYGIKPTYESIISSTSGSQYIIDNYTNIFNNYSGSQVSASPIYETATLALINYMETQGFLNDMTISSSVVRTEWDSAWGEYFSASGSLTQSLNVIVSEMSNWENVQGIPSEIAGDAPSEDGLYINADYIGYYSSTANAFKSYIDKNGNMRLGDIGGAYFNWDSSSSLLNIKDAEFSLYSDGNKVIDINPSSGSPYIAVAKANFGDSTNGIWMGKSDGEYKLDIGAPNKFIRWDGDSLNIVGGDIIMGNQDSPLIRISQGSGAGTAATAFPYFSLGDPSPLSYDDPNKGVWIGRRGGVDYTGFKTFDGSGSMILIAEDGKIITTMAPQYTFRVGDVGGAYFGWDGDSLVLSNSELIGDTIVRGVLTSSCAITSSSSIITTGLLKGTSGSITGELNTIDLIVNRSTTTDTIDSNGLITAKNGLTVSTGKILTISGASISGTNYSVSSSGSTTTSAINISGTSTLGVVNASGLITANGGLTIPSGDTLTISSGGSLVVSGTIKDGSGVEYSKTTHDHNTSYIGVDGWVGVSGTWSYASATTITVPSGATSIYSIGDKIKLTQTTVKYFYIVGVADTLLTITGGSSYTLTSATITSPYYSKSVSPLGFPQWLAYTPTGIANSNVTKSGRFMVAGRLVTVMIQATFAGGITFTTMPSLPITASSNILSGQVNYTATGYAAYVDSGTAYVPNSLHPAVLAGATTVSINGNDSAGSNISATYPITWANGDILYAYFVYEI